MRISTRVSISLVFGLLHAFIALVTIYAVTFVLGPEDYAVVGMAILVMTWVIAGCELGTGYIIYGNFHDLSECEWGKLQSTLLLFSFVVGVVAAAIMMVGFSALAQMIPLLSGISSLEKWLLSLSLTLKLIWMSTSHIMIVTGRSELLAASLLLQSVVNVLILILCLYVFNTGRVALFWGLLGGQLSCLALVLGLIIRSFRLPLELQWLRQVRSVSLGAWISSLADNTRVVVENTLVSESVGAIALGNLFHARAYHAQINQLVNAVHNVIWSVALNDARDQNSRFERVGNVWNIVYAGLVCVGLGAVFLGDEVVEFLTHGKFHEAGGWLPLLMILLLLQNAGKSATAVLYAAKRGSLYSGIRIFTVSLAVVVVFLLVPSYGVLGVLFVAISELLVTRFWVVLAARRIRVVPFQDQWVVAGCVLIGVCSYYELSANLSLLDRFTTVMGLIGTVFVVLLLSIRGRLGAYWRRFLLSSNARNSEEKNV